MNQANESTRGTRSNGERRSRAPVRWVEETVKVLCSIVIASAVLMPMTASGATVELMWIMELTDQGYRVTENKFADSVVSFPVEWLPVFRRLERQERGPFHSREAALIHVSADGEIETGGVRFFAAARLSSDQRLFLREPSMEPETPIMPGAEHPPGLVLDIPGVSIADIGRWHVRSDGGAALLCEVPRTLFCDLRTDRVVAVTDLGTSQVSIARDNTRFGAAQYDYARTGGQQGRVVVASWDGEYVWKPPLTAATYDHIYLFPEGAFLYYTKDYKRTIAIDLNKTEMDTLDLPPWQRSFAADGSHMVTFDPLVKLMYVETTDPSSPHVLGEHAWTDARITRSAVSDDGAFFAVVKQNPRQPRVNCSLVVFGRDLTIVAEIALQQINPPIVFWGDYLCVGSVSSNEERWPSFGTTELVQVFGVRH